MLKIHWHLKLWSLASQTCQDNISSSHDKSTKRLTAQTPSRLIKMFPLNLAANICDRSTDSTLTTNVTPSKCITSTACNEFHWQRSVQSKTSQYCTYSELSGKFTGFWVRSAGHSWRSDTFTNAKPFLHAADTQAHLRVMSLVFWKLRYTGPLKTFGIICTDFDRVRRCGRDNQRAQTEG